MANAFVIVSIRLAAFNAQNIEILIQWIAIIGLIFDHPLLLTHCRHNFAADMKHLTAMVTIQAFMLVKIELAHAAVGMCKTVEIFAGYSYFCGIRIVCLSTIQAPKWTTHTWFSTLKNIKCTCERKFEFETVWNLCQTHYKYH